MSADFAWTMDKVNLAALFADHNKTTGGVFLANLDGLDKRSLSIAVRMYLTGLLAGVECAFDLLLEQLSDDMCAMLKTHMDEVADEFGDKIMDDFKALYAGECICGNCKNDRDDGVRPS